MPSGPGRKLAAARAEVSVFSTNDSERWAARLKRSPRIVSLSDRRKEQNGSCTLGNTEFRSDGP